MKRATRAQVKTCCAKFQAAFGTFIDRTTQAGVCIFRESEALTPGLTREINFCQWCGKQIQFLQSDEPEGPRARIATAGQS
jgi:hypothetical protein